MIVHTTTYHAGEETTYDTDYSHSDPHATHWGKYDSAFHAWLVECVEPDDYCGDTDYGGAVLYGRFVDYWDSQGFHSLTRCESRKEAREQYEEWCQEFYAWEDEDDLLGDEEPEPECELHPGRAHKMASLACEMLSQENYYGTE